MWCWLFAYGGTERSLLEENCRPLLQEYAVQLGLEMYAVLAQRCTLLLTEHLESQAPQVRSLSRRRRRCVH